MHKTAALILAKLAISMLLVVSIIEVYQTIADVIHAMATINGMRFTASLAAALIPAAFVIFWSGNVIKLQLNRPLGAMYRYFFNQGNEKPFSRGNRRSDD